MWIIFPELRDCPIYPPPPVNTATFLPLPPATLSLSNTVTTWDWCAFASSIGETGALTARDELLSSSIFLRLPYSPNAKDNARIDPVPRDALMNYLRLSATIKLPPFFCFFLFFSLSGNFTLNRPISHPKSSFVLGRLTEIQKRIRIDIIR